jgi:hypothetical protein
MKTLTRSLISAALLAVTAAAPLLARAATTMPGVDARQARQEQRIDRGAVRGQLTGHEMRKLERQQWRVDHAEAHALADGRVTKAERVKLQHMQQRASRDIRRQKHDRQHAMAAATAPAAS